MAAPSFDLGLVEASTKAGMAAGHRVFQAHRYGPTDEAHVRALLDYLRPPHGARILDAGCGIGEVSRLMHGMRPDLQFVLANASPYQLSHCPTGSAFTPLQCDCHAMPLLGSSLDAAMYSCTLCQLDTLPALVEARRVLAPGGVLLVNDMVRLAGNGEEMESRLAARVLPLNELLALVTLAGFEVQLALQPHGDDAHFRDLLKQDGLEHLAEGLAPIIIRARKVTKE